MGLFRKRDDDEDKALAKAIAKRGLAARADIEAVRRTEATRGPARQLELTLAFTTRDGAPVRAVVRQFFDELAEVGMEAGGVASIMYDREAPQRVVVMGSARHRIVDGAVVEVAEPGGRAAGP
jgi:hypothetical protein